MLVGFFELFSRKASNVDQVSIMYSILLTTPLFLKDYSKIEHLMLLIKLQRALF